MPDKPLTVITYAASASLAAVALVYFFNPNYLIDTETSSSSANSRKKGVVGLSNPANDCFINSVLQSLAGLRELRLYLIRELHRRTLDNPEIYKSLPEQGENGRPLDVRGLLSLQSGEVTQGLKVMLDGLNERPLQKKTISAAGFIHVLEHAFATRISKSQQDAQELLQIVAERLAEEYRAGKAARARHSQAGEPGHSITSTRAEGLGLSGPDIESRMSSTTDRTASLTLSDLPSPPITGAEEEHGYPLEGRTQSQIECQHCHFIPKANPTSFVMLTLPVPQKSSASLSDCFDSHFKTEHIDDYRCDKCRLIHALSVFEKQRARAHSEEELNAIQVKTDKVKASIAEDPETPPADVELPDIKDAPTRRIARHVKITDFPNILVVHLSRSIYDTGSYSTKNTAKVSFPETLPLGGLLDRRNYKLLGVVSHKGTHNSGHYETFRRQHLYPPTSTPHVKSDNGPYHRSTTPTASSMSSPRMDAQSPRPSTAIDHLISESGTSDVLSSTASSPSIGSAPNSSSSTLPSSNSFTYGISPKRETHAQTVSSEELRESTDGRRDSTATQRALQIMDSANNKLRRVRKKQNDRWWRISDDKIKECKIGDVLGMQKEVYMLFYEIEKQGTT